VQRKFRNYRQTRAGGEAVELPIDQSAAVMAELERGVYQDSLHAALAWLGAVRRIRGEQRTIATTARPESGAGLDLARSASVFC
jgi:hypothetical protein